LNQGVAFCAVNAFIGSKWGVKDVLMCKSHSGGRAAPFQIQGGRLPFPFQIKFPSYSIQFASSLTIQVDNHLKVK